VRDLELIRDILFWIESYGPAKAAMDVKIAGRRASDIAYHLKLLRDAQYIEAVDASFLWQAKFIPTGLTWQGSSFIEAARNDTVWEKTKAQLAGNLNEISLDCIWTTLIEVSQFG